jgi:hypothetical protein
MASDYLQAMLEITIECKGREDMQDVINILNDSIKYSVTPDAKSSVQQKQEEARRKRAAIAAANTKPFDPKEYAILNSTPGIDRRGESSPKKGRAAGL